MRLSPVLLLLLLVSASPQSDGQPVTQKITLPDIEGSFELIYVPGGTFMMGTPAKEAGREADEPAPHEVSVKPFWLGKHEVTWEQFEQYYLNPDIDTDIVAQPTIPYEPPDRGMGVDDHAAMSIQWLACKGYCDWLSWRTGKKYRLPTEAEWEYACRAGSTAARPDPIGEYGWYKGNSAPKGKKDPKNRRVGQKKANAWGFHDMLGGVWEYCLDPYDAKDEEKTPVLRGGSWNDPVTALRAGSRQKYNAIWNDRDPNRPRSVWWLTDAPFAGFRVVLEVEPGDKKK